jgi:alpha-glucosidase
VHWSGDGVARFEDLPCVLRAALSIGSSGFSFYSSDVGGFSGNPSPELYVRWLQLGVFSSHVRAHGAPPREPWEYGPEVEELSRRLLTLRYRLLPYLYTAAVESAAAGLPVVRPLFLHDPDDPMAWHVDDAYLFGADLLVAPVLQEGATRRRLYLPRGQWYDFATGEPMAGERMVEVAAPLETVPVFVRAGAAIPMGPVRQHVDERECDPLELHVFGEELPDRQIVHLNRGRSVGLSWRTGAGGPVVTAHGAPGAVRVVRHPARGT